MITIFPTEHRKELWKAFQKKAQEESTTASDLFEKVIEDYLKSHGSGNPTYSLDKHMEPGFVPYPTPWAPIGTKELTPYDEREEAEMIKKLSSALANIEFDRRQKHEKKFLEKVAAGEKYATRTKPGTSRGTIATSAGEEVVL